MQRPVHQLLSTYFISFCFLLLVPFVNATTVPILEGERMQPVTGARGMVVTSHYLATTAALNVLKNGGNAIDAAVTAGHHSKASGYGP